MLNTYLNKLITHLGWGHSIQDHSVNLAQQVATLPQADSLPEPCESIFWFDQLPLQRLCKLTRGAFSGPYQEDKAAAYQAMVQLIHQERLPALEHIDLATLSGVGGQSPDGHDYHSLEQYAHSPICRQQVRIISYKGFVQAAQLGIPGFGQYNPPPLKVNTASWRGTRQFAMVKNGQALAGAIAYARLRQLNLPYPCLHTHYSIDMLKLAHLEQHYHIMATPAATWHIQSFLQLLGEIDLHYVRLQKVFPNQLQLLILQKNDPQADQLGKLLLAAGAPCLLTHLRHILNATPPACSPPSQLY